MEIAECAHRLYGVLEKLGSIRNLIGLSYIYWFCLEFPKLWMLHNVHIAFTDVESQD